MPGPKVTTQSDDSRALARPGAGVGVFRAWPGVGDGTRLWCALVAAWIQRLSRLPCLLPPRSSVEFLFSVVRSGPANQRTARASAREHCQGVIVPLRHHSRVVRAVRIGNMATLLIGKMLVRADARAPTSQSSPSTARLPLACGGQLRAGRSSPRYLLNTRRFLAEPRSIASPRGFSRLRLSMRELRSGSGADGLLCRSCSRDRLIAARAHSQTDAEILAEIRDGPAPKLVSA